MVADFQDFAADSWTPLDIVRAHNGHRIVIPRLGHCAQLEDPLQFNRVALKFLKDEPRPFRPRQW